jgi:hypothetical protein
MHGPYNIKICKYYSSGRIIILYRSEKEIKYLVVNIFMNTEQKLNIGVMVTVIDSVQETIPYQVKLMSASLVN